MSKIVLLVRHAAAEHGAYTSMLRDIDRELTSTGIIEAARMGKFISEKKIIPDLILCSAANRAKDTAKIFAEQLHYAVDKIRIDDKIYGGGARSYLECMTQIDEQIKTLVIVGHNPDISYFSEFICRPTFEDAMATASVVVVELEDSVKWKDISNKCGKFLAYYAPNAIAR